MKNWKSTLLLATVFVAATGLLYLIHYLIFRDIHNLLFYLIHNLAFLPLQVFLVVIVLERFITSREIKAKLNKLNMVVGAFFSEVGNESLRRLLPSLDNSLEIRSYLQIDSKWTHKEFQQSIFFVRRVHIQADASKTDLGTLRTFLVDKREFLLRLLENPNILENESFTDLLWATFHLTEELESRSNFQGLPTNDIKHISGDMDRMYKQLVIEWLNYVEHLKNKYPYLYSLVLRIHPFQEHPSPVIRV